jgi:hypothetical protein
VLWEGSFDNGGYDWALDIAVSPDGDTLYAAGTSGAAATAVDLSVVAFRTVEEGDDEPGTIRWARLVDGGNRDVETFGGLDLSDDGTTLALGGFTRLPDATVRALTALLDADTGATRWVTLSDGIPGDGDQRDSVAISGDRVVRASWITVDNVASGEYATQAFSVQTGQLVWQRLQGSEPTMKDTAKTVGFSADGRTVYVSGYSVLPYGQTGHFRIEPGHITTVAYTADTGDRRWVAQHNHSGVGADFAVDLVHDGSRLYVGGTFITSGVYVWPTDLAMAYAYDFGIVAYEG